jgi:hypothetical protein
MLVLASGLVVDVELGHSDRGLLGRSPTSVYGHSKCGHLRSLLAQEQEELVKAIVRGAHGA